MAHSRRSISGALAVSLLSAIASLAKIVSDPAKPSISLPPISKLPPEIICEIFLALVHSTLESAQSGERDLHSKLLNHTGGHSDAEPTVIARIFDNNWCAFSQVCREWRQVALSTPELWANIRYHDVGEEWAFRMLELSASSPLEISIARSYSSSSPSTHAAIFFEDIVSMHARRLRSLNIWGYGLESFGQLILPVGHKQPTFSRLECMNIIEYGCVYLEWTLSTVSFPHPLQHPALRSFHIHGPTEEMVYNDLLKTADSYTHYSFDHLTHLTVSTTCTQTHFLDIVPLMPQLEMLIIDVGFSHERSLQAPALDLIDISPKLKIIAFRNVDGLSGDNMTRFFRRLPLTACLIIDCGYFTRTGLRPLLQELLEHYIFSYTTALSIDIDLKSSNVPEGGFSIGVAAISAPDDPLTEPDLPRFMLMAEDVDSHWSSILSILQDWNVQKLIVNDHNGAAVHHWKTLNSHFRSITCIVAFGQAVSPLLRYLSFDSPHDSYAGPSRFPRLHSLAVIPAPDDRWRILSGRHYRLNEQHELLLASSLHNRILAQPEKYHGYDRLQRLYITPDYMEYAHWLTDAQLTVIASENEALLKPFQEILAQYRNQQEHRIARF